MALCHFGHLYIAHFLMHKKKNWTVHARILKFHIWISHEKHSWHIFFSYQDYVPFLNFGPLKKNMDEILLAKYLKTIETV